MAAPVFFLTKQLTEEQRASVRNELEITGDYEPTDDPKEFDYVDWDQEEDGTEADIWRLVWHGTPEVPHPGCALFIDRHSPDDKKVIIAHFHSDARNCEEDEVYGSFTGMDWGRCRGREATSPWLNLGMGNMDFEDFVDDIIEDHNVYERPGVVWKNSIDDHQPPDTVGSS